MFLRAALLGARSHRVSSLHRKEDKSAQWVGGKGQKMLNGESLEHNLCGVVKRTAHVWRVPDMGNCMWYTVLIFMQSVQ
jgi:hypothetical protein